VKLTKEELKNIIMEEIDEMEEMDEGLFSRMRSAFSGGKARGKAWAGNLKNVATGAAGTDPKAAQRNAEVGKRFEISANKFEKMGKDFYKDLQAMKIGDADPAVAEEVQKLKRSLKGVVTRIKNLSTKIQGMQTAGPNQPAP